MSPARERGFAALAVAAVVLSALTVVAAPAPAAAGSDLAFEPTVPSEYDFATSPGDADRPAGTATVDGESYDRVAAALAAADPGDTVRLAGRFDERVTVDTTGVTLTADPGSLAVIDGGGEDDVLTIEAADVTVERLWIRNGGWATEDNDAGVWVAGANATVVDSRITDMTFGVWVDGVDDVSVRNNTIVGRESVTPLSYRGNGVQLWRTSDSVVHDNRITDVRDGIYYSWASRVTARNNTMWDLRYGVHYMYSDHCRLENNTAFGNDVGYALMVSQHLEIRDNVAYRNNGSSGHGILVKSIDETVIAGNDVVGNGDGLYVFNSLENTIADNTVMENDLGVYLAAGSVREDVVSNDFVNNRQPVSAVVGEQVAWNGSSQGNYWSGATTVDVDRDGVSDVRYKPAGLVEQLVAQRPTAKVFASSPAFGTIRLAESSLPVVEAPGVVDHYPLNRPNATDWRDYYAGD